MNTFRLLFWLRWRIGVNTTSVKSRWASAALTLLFALAFSPLYVGAAIGAHALAREKGAGGLLLVFGLCHVTILWVSLLTGAMGRLFELDKLKRYPLRSLDVFAINTIASLGEPVVCMVVPSLVAAAFGVAAHSGAPAGLQAFAGAMLLLLVTAALLQLLLALLDDLLRREWMRYVAALGFTVTILAFQVSVGRSASKLAAEARRAGFSTEQLYQRASELFALLPTVAAPASVAGAHPHGVLSHVALGALASLLFVAAPVWLGARVMGGAVLRPGTGGAAVRRERAGAEGRGLAIPFLGPIRSLLVRRELLYLTRTPALLYQMAVVPITVVGLSFLRRFGSDPDTGTLLPAVIMTSTLASRNLMLWGYDGPGVRTLLLMPLRARDLVLTKNVAWIASTLCEAGFVFVFLTAFHPGTYLPQLAFLVPGYLTVVFAAGMIGTWVSLSRPHRPPQHGMGRRSPGGAVGLAAFLAILAVGAVEGVAVWAARSLTPDPWDTLVSALVTLCCLAASASIWWISLERNAELFERQREALVEVLAKSSDL